MIKHNPLYEAMQQAARQTMENMAFMELADHYNPEYEIPASELTWASLLISDPVQGEVRMAMTKKLLMELTASMFALEPEETTQAQRDDILHELLNTIGGLFMSNLLADHQTFQLGLPEAGVGALPPLEENSVAWKLMTDDEDPLQLFAVGASLVALHEPDK